MPGIQFKWRDWPLVVKLTVVMTSVVVLSVAAVTLLAIHREQGTFRSEYQAQSELLLDALEIAIGDALYFLDLDFLYDMMKALGRDQEIVVSGRVYNAEGRIVADAHDDEIVYRFEVDPFGRRLVGSEATVFEWEPDRLLVGRPLYAGRQLLGAVSIGLPLAPFREKVAAMRNQGIGIALLAVIAGIILVVLIGQSITDPLHELVMATKNISKGNLAQKISVQSGDELGVLASAFNNMTLQMERTLNELRESEERYALATRGANDGLWDWDLRINKIYFSSRWKAMLGCGPKEIGNGPDEWFNRIHPDDQERVKKNIFNHLNGVTKHFKDEYRILHKDKTYRWMLSRGLAVLDSDGKAYRMCGSQTDISERKRTEEQLKESLREKELLLKEIHHRVKNNLQVISSLLYLQSKRISDKKACEMFQDSQNRIRSMALIHEQLYQSNDLARIDFTEYAKNLVEHISHTYSTDSSQIRLDVAIEDVFLGIDEAIPYGLIINELVSNAFKHAFPNDPQGEIHVKLLSDSDTYTLIVDDNGVGFTKELDLNSTKSLGLQLVVNLTRQLGGTLELDRSEGTRFKVCFNKSNT